MSNDDPLHNMMHTLVGWARYSRRLCLSAIRVCCYFLHRKIADINSLCWFRLVCCTSQFSAIRYARVHRRLVVKSFYDRSIHSRRVYTSGSNRTSRPVCNFDKLKLFTFRFRCCFGTERANVGCKSLRRIWAVGFIRCFAWLISNVICFSTFYRLSW